MEITTNSAIDSLLVTANAFPEAYLPSSFNSVVGICHHGLDEPLNDSSHHSTTLVVTR